MSNVVTSSAACDALDHSGSALRSGQGGLLLLQGSRGVGISYLVDAWVHRHREEFLVVRAVANSRDPAPYAPWRKVLMEIDGLWDPSNSTTIYPMSARSLARRIVERVQLAGAPTVIIIDNWDEADSGSQRVLELLDAEMQLENLLVILAADVRAPLTGAVRVVWPIRRMISVLVTGPDHSGICEILSRRYPGAMDAQLTAAATYLVATCGHNLAAILVWLRHLEMQYPTAEVVDVIAQEYQLSNLSKENAAAPVPVGNPGRVIAQLVQQLRPEQRRCLGAWMLGSDLSVATLCDVVQIPVGELNAAIRAAHRLGLIASVWTPAGDVHSLVSAAILASVGAADLGQVYLGLARHHLHHNQPLAAIEHFLRAGPETSLAEFSEALFLGLDEVERWRSHDQIEALSGLIAQITDSSAGGDRAGGDAQRQAIGVAERDMAAVVEGLVAALARGDRKLLDDKVAAATEIADRADTHHLVQWAWQLRAVQALLAGDGSTLEHCKEVVRRRRRLVADHTGVPNELWTELAASQLSGDWSGENAVNRPRIEVAYFALKRGDTAAVTHFLTGHRERLWAEAGNEGDLIHHVMAAEIVAAVGDRDDAAKLFDLLSVHADQITVHPEGRAVLLPVASAAADLADLLGHHDESQQLHLVAMELAVALGSQWMIAEVAQAATRRLVGRLGLSERELRVAYLLTHGHPMSEIAQRLNYSSSTIRRVVSELQGHFEVLDRRSLRDRLQEMGFGVIWPTHSAGG